MNSKKRKAQELYETEPITLKEISERLRINYNTLRSWKFEDSISKPWKEPFKKRHRRMTQKQLDNLIWQGEFNQNAVKHGLYLKVPWVGWIAEKNNWTIDQARAWLGMKKIDRD